MAPQPPTPRPPRTASSPRDRASRRMSSASRIHLSSIFISATPLQQSTRGSPGRSAGRVPHCITLRRLHGTATGPKWRLEYTQRALTGVGRTRLLFEPHYLVLLAVTL